MQGLGVPDVTDTGKRTRLTQLTRELISVCGGMEYLAGSNPYAAVLERRLPVEPGVADRLRGKRILITGGEGLVGQQLIKQLADESYSVKSIASVDIAGNYNLFGKTDPKISYHTADIREADDLREVFDVEKPDIVFHLAALSEVGVGEAQKADTVSTNIFGTRNVIALCEETDTVKDCVYSSTGKAAQYVTHGIFGATVRIAEGEFAVAAQQEDSNVRYGMARFTYVYENSNLVEDVNEGIKKELVFLHTPDRYFYAQGVEEAATSLLNAMTVSEQGTLKFGSVRDIGWPLNNLDIALFQIAKSGKVVPICFSGVEKGYDPETFNGQRDLEKDEAPVMANVLETAAMSVTPSGGTVIAGLAPFSKEVFEHNLDELQTVLDTADATDGRLEETLQNAVKAMTRSQFALTDPEVLIKILRWGIATVDPEIHRDTFRLLLQSLYGRATPKMLQMKDKRAPGMDKTLEILNEFLYE